MKLNDDYLTSNHPKFCKTGIWTSIKDCGEVHNLENKLVERKYPKSVSQNAYRAKTMDRKNQIKGQLKQTRKQVRLNRATLEVIRIFGTRVRRSSGRCSGG